MGPLLAGCQSPDVNEAADIAMRPGPQGIRCSCGEALLRSPHRLIPRDCRIIETVQTQLGFHKLAEMHKQDAQTRCRNGDTRCSAVRATPSRGATHVRPPTAQRPAAEPRARARQPGRPQSSLAAGGSSASCRPAGLAANEQFAAAWNSRRRYDESVCCPPHAQSLWWPPCTRHSVTRRPRLRRPGQAPPHGACTHGQRASRPVDQHAS